MRLELSSLVLAGLLFTGSVSVSLAQQNTHNQPDLPLVPFFDSSYARAANAEECAWDHPWLENVFWRDKREDTVFTPKGGNPYQPVTQQHIATCAKRFMPASTAERELLGIEEAALADNQLDKADAAVDRLSRLVAAKEIFDRSWAYYEAADVYLSAPEPQLEKAGRLLAKLDAMGPSAAIARMLAHKDLAAEAERRDSVPLWDQALHAALAASQEITGDMRKQFAREAAYVYTGLATLKERMNDVAGARAILTEGRTVLIPLRPSVANIFDNADQWLHMQGQTPGPLQNTRWVNGGPAGTVHPMPGKPAVVAFVSANCGSRCYGDYGVLRRLMQHFPNEQIDFVLVTHTEGYAQGQLVSADSELDIIQDYFQNFLRLPAAISLWKSVYHPRVDGEMMLETPPIEKAYQPPESSHITVAVVDTHGAIRLYTTLALYHEIMLDDVIKSSL